MTIKCPKCQSDNPDTQQFCGECGTQIFPPEDISVSRTKTIQTPKEKLTSEKPFAGKYRILEEVGRGGMGIVYKAEDTKLKRTVALKFLPSEITHIPEIKERFIREAQAAAALDHPNICTIYEVDEAEEKTFISMAYVKGESLKEKIEKGPLKLDEALEIAIQVAAGLEEAHKKRVVHRDIKSANIMVTDKAQVKIMDFGIAKVAGKPTITKEGTSMGTIAYMSPEQAQGETVDHHTDIWSFGVMLYEMVTGQLPFKGDHEQGVVYSILNEEQEPMTGLRTGVPMELERIVNKAMVKNAEERYQHVEEMMIDLRSVAKGLEAETSKARLAKAARQETGVSFFKDLLQRRVPQILGIYFAGHLGIIIFMEWLVHRYPVSPYLPGFCLVALFSIIPTILLLAYFHGKSGHYQWGRAEKIGIPVNLLVSAVLLFVLFQGKDLGATTKTVSYTDEEGQMIERVIPKNEFRKNIVIFFFENETDDSTLNWLQYAIPNMLNYDLSQDLYFATYEGFEDKLKRAGYQEGIGAPLTLKKKIADDWHLNYFVTGSFLKQNDVMTIKTILYKTKNTKPITENSFSGTDIFELVDSMSDKLKHDLKIPKYHIEETEDLPVSERLTKSMSAVRNLFIADYEIWHNNDYKAALKHLENAIKEDPTFAYAHLYLWAVYSALTQFSKSQRALRAAMKYRDKLPEKLQFQLKNIFLIRGKGVFKTDIHFVEVFENAKNWVQIYPEALEGHQILANIYTSRNKPDEAISEYKRMLELDPEKYNYLQDIGFLYRQKGEFEEALKYYNQYANRFPNDYTSFTALGGLYRTMGDFEQAKTYYKKARLIEPEKISILTALANIEIAFGNFEQALELYQDMLKIAETPQDRRIVYSWQSNFYRCRGQIGKALEYFNLSLAEMRKFLSPAEIGSEKFKSIATYGSGEQLNHPYYKIISFGYFMVYRVLWDEDPDKADRAQRALDGFIKPFTAERYQYLSFMAQGSIHQLKKEFSQAIESYLKAYELSPPEYKLVIHIALGENYRELGEFEKAEEYLQKTIKILPFEPLSHYEIALVYWDMGKKEKALEHLKKALDVWEEADPEYKPAKKARDKLAEWEKK